MINKKRIKSKVYRFNIPSMIALTLTALLADPKFLAEIPPWAYISLMIIGAAINTRLRDGTGVPIEGTKIDKKLNPIDKALAREDEKKGMF